MSVRFTGFDRNDANRSHCGKHGVSIAEVEAVFRGEPRIYPDLKHARVEDRFVIVGRTEAGRAIFVVFTTRDDLVRPLNARYRHADEVARYETRDPGV